MCVTDTLTVSDKLSQYGLSIECLIRYCAKHGPVDDTPALYLGVSGCRPGDRLV